MEIAGETKTKRQQRLIPTVGSEKEEENEVVEILLVNLLPWLSLKEAVKTSSVCKRVRYLWRFTKWLDFDVFKLLSLQERLLIDTGAWKVVNLVSHVLKQIESKDLELFRIRCYGIGDEHSDHVDDFVLFAIRKRVQTLNLDFVSANFAPKKPLYSFRGPQLPATAKWMSLITLELRGMAIANGILDDLLSNHCCPNLESLLLDMIECLESLYVHDARALKRLLMHYNQDLKQVHISKAPYLTLLSYKGIEPIALTVNNVPFLSEAELSYSRTIMLPIVQLSSYLCQLHTLMLDVSGVKASSSLVQIEIEKKNNNILQLPNLKRFELVVYVDNCTVSLPLLTFFLEAFPHLYILVLKMDFRDRVLSSREDSIVLREDRMYLDSLRYPPAKKCQHGHLKVLEALCYRDNINAEENVKHVIDCAPSLEKIVIDPCDWDLFPAKGMNLPPIVAIQAAARAGALLHLKQQVPSTVEFVLL